MSIEELKANEEFVKLSDSIKDFIIKGLDTNNKQIEGLTKQIESLKLQAEATKETDVKKAVDELTKTYEAKISSEAKAFEKKISALSAERDTLKAKIAEDAKASNERLISIALDNEIDSYIKAHNVKAGITDRTKSALILEAKRQLAQLGELRLEEDENGVNRLYYYDDKGSRLTGKNAKGELITHDTGSLVTMTILADIIDESKPVKGVTTQQNSASNGYAAAFSAKTQSEADDIIREELIARGLERGTQEYSEELSKLWQERNIASLPIR